VRKKTARELKSPQTLEGIGFATETPSHRGNNGRIGEFVTPTPGATQMIVKRKGLREKQFVRP
jgi:hypothetical protein